MTGEGLATSVIVGPPAHGAVRHAETIAAITDSPVIRHTDGSPIATPVAHLHYTDRLFGITTEAAVTAFANLTASIRSRLVVTLHDVPTVDASAVEARRGRTYQQVAEIADALVVSSAHERRRLNACGVATDVTVIPLPIEPWPAPTSSGRITQTQPAVGVLGFVYPGKGHDDVLRAAARLPTEVAVRALGAMSPGHEALKLELHRQAADVGRRFVVTGPLDDEAFVAAIRAVDVPVVPAAAPSASASLATWIAAGRRPITAASDYAVEFDGDAPGLLTLYPSRDDEALAQLIATALADRSTTERAWPVPDRFRRRTVAARHVELYRTLASSRG